MTDDIISGGNRRPIQRVAIKRNGWTKARRQRFLDTLASTCNVRMATEAAGIAAGSAYKLRRREPAFAVLWQEALALGYERLEQALLEHALAGVNAIEIDPDRGVGGDDPAHPQCVPGSGITPGQTMTSTQAQIALALLNRHRASVEGQTRGQRMARRMTDEEVDAELRRRLDVLARQQQGGQ